MYEKGTNGRVERVGLAALAIVLGGGRSIHLDMEKIKLTGSQGRGFLCLCLCLNLCQPCRALVDSFNPPTFEPCHMQAKTISHAAPWSLA